MQWANISGDYTDFDDFMPLCKSHHTSYDNPHRQPGRPPAPLPVQQFPSGYFRLHDRVRRERGKAAEHLCQFADDTCHGPMQWANISQVYQPSY